MTELENRIRERLDDWVENALNPGALADALSAVLDIHRESEPYRESLPGDCYGCDCLRFYPCATVRAIAKALGIEV